MAALYQRVMANVHGSPTEELLSALRRGLVAHPWADPDLPSLVCEGQDGEVVGFQGSHPRRLELDGTPVRMVCGGQLVADPDASPGVGVLLMRRLIGGPQDLTITDGATDQVQAIWTRLDGSTGGVSCLGWTKVLRPIRLGGLMALRHVRKSHPGAGGSLPPPTPELELTPSRLIDQIRRTRARLKPAYDQAFLSWLFSEMELVHGRGPLARRVVRDDRREPLGWYVAYLPRGGIAQAIGIGSLRPDAGPVVERLFADAGAAGSYAIQGRVEHHILSALTSRRCLFRRTEWQLMHHPRDDVAAAAGREQTLLSRLDGEWWMNYPRLATRGARIGRCT